MIGLAYEPAPVHPDRPKRSAGADVHPDSVGTVTHHPHGNITTDWQPDVRRLDDPDYVDAVRLFVNKHLPGATWTVARVLVDEAGRRVLIAPTRFDRNGDFLRTPTGDRYTVEVLAELPEGTELP